MNIDAFSTGTESAAHPRSEPGTAVAAGDGDGAGGSGNEGEGGDNENANGANGGDDATGGENGSDGCGDPVCPVTGKVFLEVLDFAFGGPMPLKWIRHYNSQASERVQDLGHGWSHPFAWSIELHPHRAVVRDDKAREQELPWPPQNGEPARNGFGWALSLDGGGLSLRFPNGIRYVFAPLQLRNYVLSAVVDRNGNSIAISRDSRGLIVGLKDSAGRPYRFRNDSAGRIRID